MLDIFTTDGISFSARSAKELGAVDIGSATAGNYLTNNNETPIISGNTEVLERQEQSNNTRISTFRRRWFT